VVEPRYKINPNHPLAKGLVMAHFNLRYVPPPSPTDSEAIEKMLRELELQEDTKDEREDHRCA
jgi:hypothetical protein